MEKHTISKFNISDNARLSLAIWFDASSELWRGSAAIERPFGRKWVIDSEMIQDVVNHLRSNNDDANREDCNYRLTDVGAKLVEKETGQELPLRFFRDNYIGKK